MQDRFNSTVELANVTLTLRDDLQITLQSYGDQRCYLMEDEKHGRFYRIGIPEYTFISLLDGTTTIRDAMAQTAGVLGSDAFSQGDAATICKWLIDSELAYTAASDDATRLWEKKAKAMQQRRWQRVNPLIVRIPALRPERLVRAATRWFGWWFSWPAFTIWLAACLAALHELVSHAGHLPSHVTSILAPSNLLYLGLSFVVIKLLHEMSHGIACHRFGGLVREAGLMLIVFAPVPYVDVTSAWRFSNKYQRMMVSFAGVYTELFLAAVAALVWIHAPAGVASQLAYNVMISASITTLIFNVNPLMRFDGYYILADFVEIPNLYSLAQQYLQYVGRKYIAGAKARSPLATSRKRCFIRGYAVATFLWRLVVSLSILLTAAVLFEGAGVLLAVLAGGAWIAVPMVQLVRYLAHGSTFDRPNRIQFALVTSAIAAAAAALLWMPDPFGITAPGVIVYAEPHVVRAPYDGFVRQVFVHDGEVVQPGTELVVMENRELEVECHELRVSALQSAMNSRIYQNEQDLAAMQAEEERRQAIQSTADAQQARLAQSHVHTNRHGVVVRRDMPSLVEVYAKEGTEILTVADEQRKELRVFIPQEHVESWNRQVHRDVQVQIAAAGFSPFSSTLQSVDPRALYYLAEPALSAENGGPLAVRPRIPTDDPDRQPEQQFELLQPRFAASVALSPDQASAVHAGQIAWVRLGVARGTIGQALIRSLRNWIDQRLHPR